MCATERMEKALWSQQEQIYRGLARAIDHFGVVPTNEDLRTYTPDDGEPTGALHYLGTPDGIAEGMLDHAEKLQLSGRVIAICRQQLARS